MGNRANSWLRNTISVSVVLTGLLTLSSTLFALVHPRHIRIVLIDAHFTVLVGITLIYLAALLRRGKLNARLVAIGLYAVLIIRNIRHFVFDFHDPDHYLVAALLNLILPTATLVLLLVFGDLFQVRSEPRSFAVALRRSALILAVAFCYGLIGFQLFDTHDFHQEIPPLTATHYTVDQFGLTTHNQPAAYTKRARFFVDSLAAVSLASAFYVGVSLFAPIRFRLRHNQQDFEDMLKLAQKYSSTSEDFFKFWPRDKDFFFSSNRSAGIAYRAGHGCALTVGDPLGDLNNLPTLIKEFKEYCRLNDWRPAFIHTEAKYLKIYEKLGFEVQKIGEEGIIDTRHFTLDLAKSKYFRQINNRFIKLGYSCELLEPPYDQPVLAALERISKDWLKVPGRTERGFVMGYFSRNYINQCRIMVVRSSDGTIRAFLNQLPDIGVVEANYDFLRQAAGSPGNISDYLMLNFIKHLHENGIAKLNMGLSPLAGLSSKNAANRSTVDGLLNFVYLNAGRFYSFQGLTKFKAKYEPEWQPRYIVYAGGLRGLSGVANALLRIMRR